ncbi:hypothetical protein D7Y15_39675 [Corallococcus sp. AB030]|nr:hypothetical protein D7Y15_39675 [Corallococcus sp. AB030]RUO93080.1 hypothetical protein D7Y11_11370 [Corallococcus sp. AB018]
MHVDALRLVAVRPVDDDVLRVAVLEPVPLLVGEHIEVQRVERGQVRVLLRLFLLIALQLLLLRAGAGEGVSTSLLPGWNEAPAALAHQVQLGLVRGGGPAYRLSFPVR